MNYNQLLQILEDNSGSEFHFMLPSGDLVPSHFHVTEVGRVQKNFIDCGGTKRELVSCMLQVWTANDTHHRLIAGKLAKILRMALPVLGSMSLPVEVEYGEDVAAQYSLADVEITSFGGLLKLTGKKTDCLAPDKCGITQCCSPGCC